MSCTKEEIERKRLQALQRKKETQLKHVATPNTSATSSAIRSPNRFSPYVQTNNKYIRNVRNEKLHSLSPSKGKFYQRKENITAVNTEKFFGQSQVITGTCSMISNDRFQVELSSFLPVLIHAFKTMPSKLYDMKTKIWNFHIKEYELFMGKMIDFKTHVQIVGLPKTVLETFRKSLLHEDKVPMVDLSNIDPILLNSLMPFQYDGVCYGVSKGGRCMIADDMGLGKTIQALGIAHYFKDSWPLLIVAPSSVRYAWSSAILEFLPSVPTMYVHQFMNAKDSICDDKIVIVSYDLLARSTEVFETKNFGFVILDESHALKSIKTARFKAVQKVTHYARHIVLLSGTPLLSRPIELYSQIKLILPHFMEWKDYGVRYCAGKMQQYGWDFSGSSNMHELQLLLKHTCVIRRLKNDVLQSLPTKRREVITLNPELIKAGTEDMQRMAQKLQRSTSSGVERHNALLQYFNESAIAKQKAICDYISKLFKNRKKCLLYAHHHNVLDAICGVAESMKIKYIRIDGRTASDRRTYLVNQFQTDSDCLGAVLSITAANAGITLTAAQLVVFAELFWNPGILCQAEDRVHRIGQNDDVVIQYLIAKHTVDDFLWPIIQKKINILSEIGLEHDFSLNKVSSASQEDKTQGNLNSFVTIEHSIKDQSDKEETEELKKGSNTLNGNCDMSDEFDKLEQLNAEDFMCREEDFCDWDSVP